MKLSQSLSALLKKPDEDVQKSAESEGFQKILDGYNGAEKPENFNKQGNSAGGKAFVPDILLILRLAAAIILLVVVAFAKLGTAASLAIQIAAAALVGYDIVLRAVSDIRSRRFTCEALPVLIAAVLSFCLGRGTEAVAALILLQLAFRIRSYAINHIKDYFFASMLPCEGDSLSLQQLHFAEEVTAPFDCTVAAGEGTADFSFITGDGANVSLRTSDFVPAGAKCVSGQMTLQPVCAAGDSVGARMENVIRLGSATPSKIENKLCTYSNYFALGMVAISAVLLILLPTVFKLPFSESLRRVLTVIAIVSPGAVLLTVPLTFLAGMTAARRQGIVFKSALAIEKISKTKSVVFEKNGTLTSQSFAVTEIKTDKMDPETFLKVAAYAEANADNPVARAIVAAYGEEISGELVQNFISYEGGGVSVSVDSIEILLGNEEFLLKNNVSMPGVHDEGYVVHMSVNGIYAGRIILADYIVPTALSAISSLEKAGVERISMISGDSRAQDVSVAHNLGIDEYVAECKPEDKPRRIKEMNARIDSKASLAYVTAHVGEKAEFEAADVGIAINGLKNSENLELADVTIMDNSPSKVSSSILIAIKTKRYIMGILLFAVVGKLIIALLAALGFAPLWFGVLLDVCVSLAAVLDCLSAENISDVEKPGLFSRF